MPANTRKTPSRRPARRPTASANPQPETDTNPQPAPSGRKTEKASDHFETVVAALKAAGRDGLSLTALGEQTGIKPRVLHNVCWRLEGSPEVRDKDKYGELRKPAERQIHRKDGTGSRVVYVVGKGK